ncbi:[protein-PII] uridylyltransferase [Halorhodospira abdelmalekii]|uniref:[protein-PII] uridylyltransferase n=1 Tax=Halorhodospira abdelmalekii TaxID=421629 RepID=UPI0019080C27|nr:[protein-PII] uridylyltransferase [Halorhodospira abdelmalekii]MBK1735095.1 [protein-PII] uridylyltransferase [Halorhodospira abdelmalekii]
MADSLADAAPDVAAVAAAARSGSPLVPALRGLLSAFDAGLYHRFRAGVAAATLILERTEFVDALIGQLWTAALYGHPTAHEGTPSPPLPVSVATDAGVGTPGCALLAIGGYGRGELHPGSDIDVLVLIDPPRNTVPYERIECFIAQLWDLGLEIGHGVRTLEESLQASASDVCIATTLLESRTLAGDPSLLPQARAELDAQRQWPSRLYFEAKLAEQQQRHARFHDTAYNLEPNIKSSPGGLRDIQMIGWVAKRHFGSEDLHGLVGAGFLTEAEYQTLYAAQSYLWDVRFGLHMIAKRREDRLLFDHQLTLARLFDDQDDDRNLAVEQFMQRYFRTVMRISRLNELLLQHFAEEILHGDDDAEPQPINRRFQSRRGYLEVTDPRVFARYPFALLEAFLILEQHSELKGVRASTIRLIRQHRTSIDERFRRDLRCRSLFIEILRQPQGVTHALRRMHRYGVLGRYIPDFARITGRMQYDLFHAYTVDSHTLFVIGNLRRLTLPEHRDELPLAHAVMAQAPKPELLYLAGLFHDIAKGRGGDHSQLGARAAYEFCIQHGLGAYDARLVAWLVLHHLTLSTTAQRKDISDPAVITELARTVGNQAYLDALYLLTIADIRATNPALWNTWRSALLDELYVLTRRAIRRGTSNPIGKDELIRDTQRDARRILRQRGLLPKQIRTLWQHLPDDYFLRHNAEEIAWHTEGMLGAHIDDMPLVLVDRNTASGGMQVFLYAEDRPDLFAHCVSALDRLGLDIYEARIITTVCGYTLDSYLVLERQSKNATSTLHISELANTRRRDEIRAKVRAAACSEGLPPLPVTRQVPRQLRHFQTATEIVFNDDPLNGRTIVELTTADRPGLLARIGAAFSRCEIRVKNAKIATMGERAEDIFFITDTDGAPLRRPEQFRCVRDTLTELVDEEHGVT